MTTTLTIYDITCTIFITTHTLYMTSHLLCMMSHSLCVVHHTMTLSMTSTLYVYDIFTLYGITHSVMTTQPLSAFTATMPDITLNVFLILHTKYQCYEEKCIYVITASIYMTPYALHLALHLLFMILHHAMTFTQTVFMSSHPGHLSSHPQLLSSYLQFIQYNTFAICVFSNPKYVCDPMNSV